MIPPNLRALFWDVNIENLNPADYPDYIIGRILELGNEHAVKWMKQMFSEAEIKRVVATDRRLSRKSANFWALIYGIAPEEVAALRPATASVSATDVDTSISPR